MGHHIENRAREILRHLSHGPLSADEIGEQESVAHTYNIAPMLTRLRACGLAEWATDIKGRRVTATTRRGAPAGVVKITSAGRIFIYDRSQTLGSIEAEIEKTK